MGHIGTLGLMHERRIQIALDIAIRAGSISTDCLHEPVVNAFNHAPAFALAHDEFLAGKHAEFQDLAEIDEALRAAFDAVPEACAICSNAELYHCAYQCDVAQ